MEGKKKAGEFQKQGPFTSILFQKNTSANNVSVSVPFKRLNQGICFNAPTPVVGNGRKGILNIEKLEYCQLTGTTGNPNLVLDSAMPWLYAMDDLETMRKATSEGMMDGLKENEVNFKGKGKEVAGDDATASQLQQGMEGKEKAGEFQKQGDSNLAPAHPKPFRGGKKNREPNKPAEPKRTKPERGEKKNRKPNKPAEPNRSKLKSCKPKRKVPTRNIADLEAKRKVKSVNEVAADGATAAQSHEEGAFRPPPLKGPYKDSPGSTPAQADHYEESRLEYYQLTSDSDLAPAHPKPFSGGKKNQEPNKPAEPNRTKPERNIADLEAKRKATSEAMMDGPKDPKDKSGNEVAADGATPAQSHDEGVFPLKGPYKDLPGATSAQADNNEKGKKTRFERIGPYVLNAAMLLVGGIAGAYFFSQNASHVKILNEKANEVNQNITASSPSYNLKFSIFNIETGTSEGQGCRKAG